eukprot:m51a1_g14201 putative map kinase phosphatase (445) ;mRNA; f:141543-143278
MSALLIDSSPLGLLEVIEEALKSRDQPQVPQASTSSSPSAAAVVLAWRLCDADDGSCVVDPSSPPSLMGLAPTDCYLVSRIGSHGPSSRAAAVGAALALERALEPPGVAEHVSAWIAARPSVRSLPPLSSAAAEAILPPRSRLRAAVSALRLLTGARAAALVAAAAAAAAAAHMQAARPPSLSLVVPRLDIKRASSEAADEKDEEPKQEAMRLLAGRDHADGILRRGEDSSAKAQEIGTLFPDVCDFLDRVRDSEDSVALVHCRAGVSRSASLVISYVMWARGLGQCEALDYVAKLRPAVSPHLGFIAQLRLWEAALKERSLDSPPVALFCVCVFAGSSSRLMVGREVPRGKASLDPRFYFVVRACDKRLWLWRGSSVDAGECEALEAARKVSNQLRKYRGASSDPEMLAVQGQETDEFWEALGDTPGVVAERHQYDADAIFVA